MRRSKIGWVFALGLVPAGLYLHYGKKAEETLPPLATVATRVERREPDVERPAETEAASAAVALAELPARSGDAVRDALALLPIVRSSPGRPGACEALAALGARALEEAAAARAAGDPSKERAALTAAYLATADAAARAPIRDALERLAQEHFFSRRPSPDAHLYTVERGDSLTKVAARFNFPVEGIQKINGLKSTSLRIGERLKVPSGPIEILVVKGEFRLALLAAGKLVREYAIGTGREGSTPEATFTIEEKIPEPTWHSREGVFPFGHPKNILGTRWLGFNDTAEYQGFGIHGTPFPESIGQEVSSGCIRMRNAEVEELFGLVPRGTTVTIIR